MTDLQARLRAALGDAYQVERELGGGGMSRVFLAAEGVIHRDVKPENILLQGGHAVLTDFGVARALVESRSGGRLTDTGLALGTPGYMSPEQAAGERHVDARADVYALAVVGYEMLAGFPPFAGPTAQALIAAHLTATPKPLTDTRPEAPPAVANAIARALAKDPNARLRTAPEFRDALGAGLAHPRDQALRRTGWLVAAGAAIVAVALGGALMSRSRGAVVRVDPKVVAVFPFRVTGADASLRYLREGMVDLLGAKLTGEDGVRAADTRTVLSAWRRAGGTGQEELAADGARSVARRVGAGKLVLGEVVGTPNRLILSAAIVASSSGRSTPQASVDGPPDSLLTLVERLVRQLLATEVASGGRDMVTLTTSSLPALQA